MKLNHKTSITYGVIIFGLILDQLTKTVAKQYLSHSSIDLGLLRFDLVFNTGTAYGMFKNYTTILTWLGVFVILYLFFSLKKLITNKFEQFIYGCILAGAIGNTIDRILFSKVTDFINIQIIPVFNIADILLNIGIFGIILNHFIHGKKQP